MKPSSVKVLDCTLRDGGYYNDWDFSQELVNAYLHSVGEAGVDLIEIGFRLPAQESYRGAYAYSTDSFLEKLPIPKSAQLGVMINAGDLLKAADGAVAAVDRMFDACKNSPVDFVRVATHLHEIDGLEPAMRRLKELGYLLTINLMRVGRKSPETLIEAVREIRAWGQEGGEDLVDVLYFADSLGNMEPETVKDIAERIHAEWQGEIGIHTHDNMGRAIANTLVAIDSGVTWVDGTIYGMGRGAGNAQTEHLLIEFAQRGVGDYHADALFPLVLGEFEQLHQKYGWGKKLLYYLSGAYNIHPSYVQEILRSGSHSADHAISALQSLRSAESESYSLEQLQESMLPRNVSFEGTWSAAGWAEGRPVLVIAAGPWVREHVEHVVDFIDRTDPVVICLNTSLALPHDKVTAFAACHAFRFATETDQYLNIDTPLIAPAAALPEQVAKTLAPGRILDYGLTVKANQFSVEDTGCVIPQRLVAAYILAMANASGASLIYLAGFDGYAPTNPLQKKMEHVFHCYHAMPDAIPLLAVTPTTYSIAQHSLYAL